MTNLPSEVPPGSIQHVEPPPSVNERCLLPGFSLAPFSDVVMRGDFDADGEMDTVLQVRAEKTMKDGVLFCLSSAQQPVVLAAGAKFLGVDSIPVHCWRIVEPHHRVVGLDGRSVQRPSRLAIWMHTRIGAGLCYWDGSLLQWVDVVGVNRGP